MRFFLSRTAHETPIAYLKRAAETLRAEGVDDSFPREPAMRGAFVLHPESGAVVGYLAYSG